MRLTRQSTASGLIPAWALPLIFASLLGASAPALADPCSDTPYSGCLTDPASYQIKYRFNSTLPLTNIVDMWHGTHSLASEPVRLPR